MWCTTEPDFLIMVQFTVSFAFAYLKLCQHCTFLLLAFKFLRHAKLVDVIKMNNLTQVIDCTVL